MELSGGATGQVRPLVGALIALTDSMLSQTSVGVIYKLQCVFCVFILSQIKCTICFIMWGIYAWKRSEFVMTSPIAFHELE